MMAWRWTRNAALAALLAGVATGVFAQAERTGPTSREAAIFEFLAAEVAAQRGEIALALGTMGRLAKETRDPQIARRAVEIAIRARALDPALELAALLVEIEPDSPLGRDLVASLLGNKGELDKATESVAALAAASGERPFFLSQLSYYFAKFSDKKAVLAAVRTVIAPYAALPESRYALGVAALLAGEDELARAESLAVLEARPDWAQGAILHAQVLRKLAPDEVIPFYQAFVAKNPQAKDAWLQLARELTTAKRSPEARAAFRAAEKLAPGDAQLPYAVGLLALQAGDFVEAETALRRSLGLGPTDPGAVYQLLGQAAEGQKRPDEAIDWYQRVEGADWMRSQLRIATLLAKRDGLAKAREFLQSLEPRTQDDRIQMIQIEAQLLRDARAWGDTYEMLTQAVAQFPESFELLYDRAMAAERVNKLDVLEADLRRVIALKPDYAHAYNALGYTLADRTDRLDEAYELIGKALKLTPGDPFILDSLGWVEYRRGNLEEALKHLREAHAARPDPEIAAHLGEVLWKLGRRDEAKGIWQAALTENPDHESLLAVMQKFKP
jgi:tetratricopeptide (TPR) repeat protein